MVMCFCFQLGLGLGLHGHVLPARARARATWSCASSYRGMICKQCSVMYYCYLVLEFCCHCSTPCRHCCAINQSHALGRVFVQGVSLIGCSSCWNLSVAFLLPLKPLSIYALSCCWCIKSHVTLRVCT